MFDKIKNELNAQKAELYLALLLESFFADYNDKIIRKEDTLKCTGKITINSKDINYTVMNMLFDKAWDMGAIVIEKRSENSISLCLSEQGRGVKHTLTNK